MLKKGLERDGDDEDRKRTKGMRPRRHIEETGEKSEPQA